MQCANIGVGTIHNIHAALMDNPELEQDFEQLQIKRNYLLSVFERFSDDTDFLLEITVDEEQRASHSRIYEKTKQVFREANSLYAQQAKNFNSIDTEPAEHVQSEGNHSDKNSDGDYQEIQREPNKGLNLPLNTALQPIIVQMIVNCSSSAVNECRRSRAREKVYL